MCEGLFVPRPSGDPCQIFIRRIGKEDIQVSWAIQMQNLFQLFHIQIGSGKQKKKRKRQEKEHFTLS